MDNKYVVIKVEPITNIETLELRGTKKECEEFQKDWQNHYDHWLEKVNENSQHRHVAPTYHVLPDNDVVDALY